MSMGFSTTKQNLPNGATRDVLAAPTSLTLQWLRAKWVAWKSEPEKHCIALSKLKFIANLFADLSVAPSASLRPLAASSSLRVWMVHCVPLTEVGRSKEPRSLNPPATLACDLSRFPAVFIGTRLFRFSWIFFSLPVSDKTAIKLNFPSGRRLFCVMGVFKFAGQPDHECSCSVLAEHCCPHALLARGKEVVEVGSREKEIEVALQHSQCDRGTDGRTDGGLERPTSSLQNSRLSNVGSGSFSPRVPFHYSLRRGSLSCQIEVCVCA